MGELTADWNKADVIFDKASETVTVRGWRSRQMFLPLPLPKGEDKGVGLP